MPEALADAIARGQVSIERVNDWPCFVWGRTTFVADKPSATATAGAAIELVWEAKLTNREVPEYKAYPVVGSRKADHCMPRSVREALWPNG
jgi:hypothetical protein